jgi:pyruvate/oxaloacetate carboxyltransferase
VLIRESKVGKDAQIVSTYTNMNVIMGEKGEVDRVEREVRAVIEGFKGTFKSEWNTIGL